MDLELIRYLKAVEDYGSINAASERLFVAKSAISKAIKQSEVEFGFKLLDRSSYRVQLSPKGKMYLNKSSKLFRVLDELENIRKQLSDNIESSIKISSSVLFDLNKFIDLIKKTNKQFPKTTIYLEREILSGEKMLINKEVDIAITESILDKANIDSKKVDSVSMPLVISRNHEFNDSKNKNI